MNKFKANREDLDVRIKALELSVEFCKQKEEIIESRRVVAMAYNFYDFLSSDVEVSIKDIHLIKDE